MFETLGQGQVLLADRAYDSDGLRETLAAQGAWGNIRLMPNRVRRQVVGILLSQQRICQLPQHLPPAACRIEISRQLRGFQQELPVIQIGADVRPGRLRKKGVKRLI